MGDTIHPLATRRGANVGEYATVGEGAEVRADAVVGSGAGIGTAARASLGLERESGTGPRSAGGLAWPRMRRSRYGP